MMKRIAIATLAAALSAACSGGGPVVTGTIDDATRHTVTVVTDGGERITFLTMDADMSACRGLTAGSPIKVVCEGAPEAGFATARSISTPETYTALTGRWSWNNDSYGQQITISPRGEASSTGSATLLYERWSLDGDTLILSGRSLGNGQTIEFVQEWRIARLTADALHLESKDGERLQLTRSE